MHGKTSLVAHDDGTILHGLPQPFVAGRYHSLIAQRPLPAGLEVTASTVDREIMGVRHTRLTVAGVQFHPESVLTPHGSQLLGNFLQLRAGCWSQTLSLRGWNENESLASCGLKRSKRGVLL
jgi:anthranilate/para-aminobenzoate synthase component II